MIKEKLSIIALKFITPYLYIGKGFGILVLFLLFTLVIPIRTVASVSGCIYNAI